MTELTFEKLPQAVGLLLNEVHEIKRLLLEKDRTSFPAGDHILTIQEASHLLHLSVPTCYGLVHRKEIPTFKKGKRLYFSRDELITWVKTGRKKTLAELITETETGLRNRGRKL